MEEIRKRIVLSEREFWIPEAVTDEWFVRLVSKIDFGGHAPGSCWNWMGHITVQGYGSIQLYGRSVGAHRAVYRSLVCEPPAGYHLHHLCENRRCVNPNHLQPLTPEEHRAVSPQAAVHYFKGQTHCKRGHPLIEGNLLNSPWKRCAICNRDWNNRQNAIARAARPPRQPATHCTYGHEWTPENTRTYKGKRFCRACHNALTTVLFHERSKALREFAQEGVIPAEAAPESRLNKTHCRYGHPLPEPGGLKSRPCERVCQICVRKRTLIAYYKKKGNLEMVNHLRAELQQAS